MYYSLVPGPSLSFQYQYKGGIVLETRLTTLSIDHLLIIKSIPIWNT